MSEGEERPDEGADRILLLVVAVAPLGIELNHAGRDFEPGTGPVERGGKDGEEVDVVLDARGGKGLPDTRLREAAVRPDCAVEDLSLKTRAPADLLPPFVVGVTPEGAILDAQVLRMPLLPDAMEAPVPGPGSEG